MATIIKASSLNKFKLFTLNRSYDSSNTKFVRVRDGYAVQADPLQVKDTRNGGKRIHHVSGEGWLYGRRNGYTVAYNGWTSLIDMENGTYKCFNPFQLKGWTAEVSVESYSSTWKWTLEDQNVNRLKQRIADLFESMGGEYTGYVGGELKFEHETYRFQIEGENAWNHGVKIQPVYEEYTQVVTLKLEYGVLTIVASHPTSEKIKTIGKYSTVFGDVIIKATPFKGIKSFIKNIISKPEWAYTCFNEIYYNKDFSLSCDVSSGKITSKQVYPTDLYHAKHGEEWPVVFGWDADYEFDIDVKTQVHLNGKVTVEVKLKPQGCDYTTWKKESSTYYDNMPCMWCMNHWDSDGHVRQEWERDFFRLGLANFPSDVIDRKVEAIIKAQLTKQTENQLRRVSALKEAIRRDTPKQKNLFPNARYEQLWKKFRMIHEDDFDSLYESNNKVYYENGTHTTCGYIKQYRDGSLYITRIADAPKVRVVGKYKVFSLVNSGDTFYYVYVNDFVNNHVENRDLKKAISIFERRVKKEKGVITLNDVRNDREGTVAYCFAGTKQFLYTKMKHLYNLVKSYDSWSEVPDDIMSIEWLIADTDETFDGYNNPFA